MNTSTSRPCWTVILYVLYIVVCSCPLHAQTLAGPSQAEPGSLFLVDVSVPVDGGTVHHLSFNPATVQYMGLVAPTPEVQLTGESTLDITPDRGGNGRYQVKFLSYPNASGAEFAFVPPVAGGAKLNVAFVVKVEEKKYHWHVLAGGIILFLVAWAVWRYQKKNPGLMSTRSLFLNFDELQKARERFFAGQADQEPKSDEQMPVISDPAGAGKLPAGGPLCGSTLEMPIPVLPPETAKPDFGAPASPIPETSQSGIPAVPQEPERRNTPADAPVTAEMPVSVPMEQPGQVEDTSKKTVARGDISGKMPASSAVWETVSSGDSTVPSMPKTPKTVSAVDAPAKTVSRSGLSKSAVPGAVAPVLLHVKLTDSSGRVFEGQGVEILIGRAKECNISMTAAEVSRRHLLLKRDSDRILAVPQTSSNLTEINGSRIKTATEIHSGYKISLGGTIFTVEISGS